MNRLNFIEQPIIDYAEKHTTELSPLLNELDRQTHLRILKPQMLSGSMQGQFLKFISTMLQPKYILEIGTFTGFSAICLAQGLADNGHVDTIEVNEELEDFVLEFVEKANLSEKVTLHIGNALDILPTLNKAYDLVFLDADKGQYLTYYKHLIEVLPSGAYIIADNILWSGKVVEEKKDRDTLALDNFNKFVQKDERVENVLLPFRDGLMLIRKL